MWNDTGTPLAYLITFRTYGTWLHGDPRGSVNRFRNQYGSSRLPEEQRWLEINSARLKNSPVNLNALQRSCVNEAIRETCDKRNWALHAINVRTNHSHSVAAIGNKSPAIALNAFKANSTRLMRERGCWQSERSPWVDKGSTRYLWNEQSLLLAVDYVINGQGDDLPNF
ncbi:MAG: transposase [Acidobacteria bacterium]|nr:transposase [Acidobacteriota bacterium]